MKEKMNILDYGNSKILNLIFKPAGLLMGSRVRQWLMNPNNTLQLADVKAAQTILEVGCGTGFFTIPAAHMIGERGRLVALDASSGFLSQVSLKVKTEKLKNVQILQCDALATGLNAGSMDKVLLFGVIPFPLLPLERLLPEMHRVLRPEGTMSVWLFPPVVHFWVPRTILASGYFNLLNKRKNVYNFVRSYVSF